MMNLKDSLMVVLAMFHAHIERTAHRPSKHLGSKLRAESKALCRSRRKRERQARRRQRMFAR